MCKSSNSNDNIDNNDIWISIFFSIRIQENVIVFDGLDEFIVNNNCIFKSFGCMCGFEREMIQSTVSSWGFGCCGCCTYIHMFMFVYKNEF